MESKKDAEGSVPAMNALYKGSGPEDPQLKDELAALMPLISEIAKINGTPGISVGIMVRGEDPTWMNYGLRNVESSLPTSEHTMYHIASVGKFITALAISKLVDDGLLDWDKPLHEYLSCPPWTHPSDYVIDEVTIRDCLVHTTGLASQNRLWLAERGRMNYIGMETAKCVSGLDQIEPVGTRWVYNNWGYAVAGKLIRVLTGKSWGEYLEENIFRPLGMKDTVTDPNCDWENIAQGYMNLTDGTPVLNGRPAAGNNTCQAGASGIQTSVHDLMLLYKEVFTDQKKLLKAAPLLEGQIDLQIREQINEREQSYAMGWVRTQLPGVPSMNRRDSLVIGQATKKWWAPGPILLHHNGNYPGYTSAAFLLPDTQTAVVVLTNSVGKIEVAEIVGQMIIETILNHGKRGIQRIDFVRHAQRAMAAASDAWARMAIQLEKKRKAGTFPLPLNSYVGRYYTHAANWYMEIYLAPTSGNSGIGTTVDGLSLWMCMQGHKQEECQVYELKHYHNDVFSWLLTWDDCVHRGRSPICQKDFYLLKFRVSDGKNVRGLTWSHDSTNPRSDYLTKHG